MPGFPCGNNPHFRMSPGDRAAVDEFRAHLLARAKEKHMADQPSTETQINYFLQSRPAPSQPWQQASGVKFSWESRTQALGKLAARREMQPSWEHRLVQRTTTVTEEPLLDAAETRLHDPDPS